MSGFFNFNEGVMVECRIVDDDDAGLVLVRRAFVTGAISVVGIERNLGSLPREEVE